MDKNNIFISSAVADNFDLIESVKLCVDNNFTGIQLYLNDKVLEKSYSDELIALLKESEIKFLFHLPDVYKNEYDTFLNDVIDIPNNLKKALIHYTPGMIIPEIEGYDLGLENSTFGYKAGYLNAWLYKCRMGEYFKVFDIPRLFAYQPRRFSKVADFVKETIFDMEISDILHLIDLERFGKERDLFTSIGGGFIHNFFDIMATFEGVVVLEFEDMYNCLKSREVLIRI